MPGKTLHPNRPVANCVELASVLQNPLLQDPTPANAPAGPTPAQRAAVVRAPAEVVR